MKRWKQFTISTITCVALAIPARAGEIVDRIVANVNGHILLQSDWEEETAFESFVNARSLDAVTAVERKAALDRLIDQELLREQVKPSEKAPKELVAARVAEIRKALRLTSPDDWHASLQRYGLTEAVVEKRLGNDIELMRMVEARLRPSIHVDTRAVESYYRERLLPELEKAGSKAVTLPEVFGQIRDLLTEQKVTQMLDSWLVSLRSESRIQTSALVPGEQAR
jgi:peptidyl-prolyl cis-trans isomerase SurA